MNEIIGTAIVFACIFFVGYLNNQDIEKCKKLGNSEAVCVATFNP